MNSKSPPPRGHKLTVTHIVSLVVAALVAIGGVSFALTTDESTGPDGHKITKHSITITARNAKGDPVQVTAPAAQVAQAADGHAEAGLNHDNATPAQLQQDDRAASPLAPSITGPVPLASANQPGCLTRQINHNYSYRNGVRPSLIVPHLTVSPNTAGTGDVFSIDAFFDRPATQASSNYVIDSEGNCLLMVPESLKAWAQANYNGATACSIEVINTGNEARYAGTAGMNKIAKVIHDCAARWNIPLRRGAVSGGSVVRSGVIDHFHLGPAGGGHFDVHNFGAGCVNGGPGADTWKCVDTLIALAQGHGAVKPPSKTAIKDCRGVVRFQIASAKHKQGSGAKKLYAARERALKKGHYRCGRHGTHVVLTRA